MIDTTRPTLAAVASAAVLAIGCGDDDEPPVAEQEETTTLAEARQPDKQLEAVLDGPARFTGEMVTVTGEADGAVAAPAAFRVVRPRGSETGITVLPTETAREARSVVTNQTVTVTGRVLEVTPDLAERGEFLFESDDNASNTVERIETDYVIAADEVDIKR